MKRPVAPLPPRTRAAAMVCLSLAALVGVMAASEGLTLAHLAEVRDAPPSRLRFGPDPELEARLQRAQLAALEQAREPRMVILFSLAVTCALVFVAAGRLLRPGALPREGMRKLLAGAALLAALLRTVDGAQETVVAQRTVPLLEQGMSAGSGEDPRVAQMVRQVLPRALVGTTVLRTVFVAGLLLVLAQHFRSERVKEWVAAEDGQSE